MLITSRDNSLLRQARATRDGKVDELIFVEGLRLCEEALQSGLAIEAVIFSEEIAGKEKASHLISELQRVSKRTGAVSEKLLESISYTKTPQGIVVLAQRPESTQQRLEAALADEPLVVVMHRINNPVNVGAILRSAEGAGATGVIATTTTTDPFSPKSLRGAMGSAFRLPLWIGPTYVETLTWCNQRQILPVASAANASTAYTDVNWTSAAALILGPESTGLSEEEIKGTDRSVRIPMSGAVESLNVSVAAGIILFEAARQRRMR